MGGKSVMCIQDSKNKNHEDFLRLRSNLLTFYFYFVLKVISYLFCTTPLLSNYKSEDLKSHNSYFLLVNFLRKHYLISLSKQTKAQKNCHTDKVNHLNVEYHTQYWYMLICQFEATYLSLNICTLLI